MSTRVARTPSTPTRRRAEWQLRLYVAGQTPKCLAAGDQILAVPTLVRKFPEPIRKIIGDLSNSERVLVGLDVQPVRKVDG